MPNIVKFHDQELTVLDLEGQHWLNAFQIGTGLGFSNPGNAIRKIYHHHKSEFSPDMTTLIELPTATGPKLTRIFSARGAALLAMLAKTDRAAEFRGWVLDVLERTPSTSSFRAREPRPGIHDSMTLDSRLHGSDGKGKTGMTVRENGSDGRGALAVVLTGTQKPYGWDIWPHVAHYARLGLDAAEIARLLDRKKDYISKTLQTMRKAGAIASHALTGRPMRPLLPKGRAV